MLKYVAIGGKRMALNIVMGMSGSGRTHFIKEHFPDWKHFSVGDYQKKILSDMGNPDSMELHAYAEVLIKANEQIKEDVLEALKAGHDVVLEHTLYKRKRRLPYIESFKAVTDAPIDIYVVMPSKEQFRRNLESSEKHNADAFEGIWKEREYIEFPNVAEGYNKIFHVIDGDISEIHTVADITLIERAKQELEEEAAEELEQKKKAEEHKKFLEELNQNGFWHFCECCGKKKFMTPEQAFNEGWDYPPRLGAYGVISPRTCGTCSITDTVWWKINMNKISMKDLSGREKTIIQRILSEPYSLLELEDDDSK